MAQQPRKALLLTPFGIARYIHVNKPDEYVDPKTGKRAKPRYKAQLIVDGADRDSLKGDIDKAVDEAWAELTEGLPKAKLSKLRKAYPYDEELDEDGEATGRLVFKFSRNAEIEVKGELIKRSPPLVVDAKQHPVSNAPVWTGSEIRIAYSTRSYLNDSTQCVGITLDLAKLQVRKLATPTARPDSTFGEVEGWSNEAPPEGAKADDDDIPF